MKFFRIAVLFLAAALSLGSARAQVDYSAIDAKLDNYVLSMTGLAASEKCSECDFIIGAARDSLLRDHIATYLYSKFIASKVMGDEAVAICLLDNWFAPGKVHFKTEDDLFNARLFASVNRQSLIGMQVPELMAYPPSPADDILAPEDVLPCDGRPRVLFIYDTSCATCKLETALLEQYLPSYIGPDLDFIAFYSGTDAAAWAAWRADHLKNVASGITVKHYWDPERISDFQIKFGVLSTPKMFLVDADGVIVGRGLDTGALEKLIPTLDAAYRYGSDESLEIIATMFSGVPDNSPEEVLSIVKYLEKNALSKNRQLYKHITGDLLYYLAGQRTWTYQAVVPYVADSLILGREEIWNTENDRVQVLSMAEVMSKIAHLAPIGSKLPAIKVPGTLLYGKKQKAGLRRLDKIGGKPSIIIFHVQGCSRCETQLAQMRSMLTDKKFSKYRFFLVDMDEVISCNPALGNTLMDSFDLSSMPFILSADSKGRITGKYLSLP